MKTVHAVTGPVPASELGKVLIHEHIICVSPVFYRCFGEKWFSREKIIETAVTKLKNSGFQTIVDGSPAALGRDVCLLAEISRQSGVNIIASSGFYTTLEFGLDHVPPEIMAQYFIDECLNGAEGTSIRPGMLKCAVEPGSSLRAIEVMALVQKETGLSIFAHSNAHAETGLSILDIFEKHGVDPARVIIGHTGDSGTADYALKLLKRGCYVEIDRIYGNNTQAANIISELAGQGYLNRLLISHDQICYDVSCNNLQNNPRVPHNNPDGLRCISDFILPQLREKGFGEADIEQLIIVNPREVLR